MDKGHGSCRHPNDIDACLRALTAAWRGGRLETHCILNGLAEDSRQCSQALLAGLPSGGSKAEGDVTDPSARRACEAALLLGCRSELEAARTVLFDAYRRLVGSVVWRKFGFTEGGQPSADDVFQDIFLGLYRRFRQELTLTQGSLGTYIGTAAVHHCTKAIQRRRPPTMTPDMEAIEDVRPPLRGPAGLTAAMVEGWEDLDRRLIGSSQGDLVNRIILAHHCLEACHTGKKLPAKQLLADWQALAKRPDGEVARLHSRAVAETRRHPSQGTVCLAAELINEGEAQPWEVAIIYAGATGLDLTETRRLLDRLAGTSAGALHARWCRMMPSLREDRRTGDEQNGGTDEGPTEHDDDEGAAR